MSKSQKKSTATVGLQTGVQNLSRRSMFYISLLSVMDKKMPFPTMKMLVRQVLRFKRFYLEQLEKSPAMDRHRLRRLTMTVLYRQIKRCRWESCYRLMKCIPKYNPRTTQPFGKQLSPGRSVMHMIEVLIETDHLEQATGLFIRYLMGTSYNVCKRRAPFRSLDDRIFFIQICARLLEVCKAKHVKLLSMMTWIRRVEFGIIMFGAAYDVEDDDSVDMDTEIQSEPPVDMDTDIQSEPAVDMDTDIQSVPSTSKNTAD